MKLARLVIKRVLWAIPVAWGMMTIAFFLSRVVAGDPTYLYVPPDADQATINAVRDKLGLGNRDASLASDVSSRVLAGHRHWNCLGRPGERCLRP